MFGLGGGGGAGPPGTNGTAGTNGTNGTDGKTVRSGSGVPSSGLGVDGDFYINTAAFTIYGPKTAGAWGSATSITGPAGAVGATGPAGPVGIISVTPIDGTSDDWPNLMNTVVPAAIALGKAVQMLPGTGGQIWQCNTAVKIPAGAHIIGTPQTKIRSNIGQSSGVGDSVFTADGTLGTTVGTDKTTTTAATTRNATTLSLTANIAPAAGTTICLSHTDNATTQATYKTVGASTGSGPYTITLDRPIQRIFASGSSVQILTNRPENIIIEGNGMQISGQAARYVEFLRSFNCHVEGLVFDSANGLVTTGSYMGSFDTGSAYCTFKNIVANCGSTALVAAALALESNEGSVIMESRVTKGIVGYRIHDGSLCELRGNFAHGNAEGVRLSSNSTDTYNNFGCKIVGGSYSNNTAAGIRINVGCVATSIFGASISQNTGDGIQMDNSSSHPHRNTSIVGCDISYNTIYGVQIQVFCYDTAISDCSIFDNNAGGISVNNANAVIGNCTLHCNRGHVALNFAGGGSSQVKNCVYTSESTAGSSGQMICVNVSGTSNCDIDGIVATLGGDNSGSYDGFISPTGSGRTSVRNIRTQGGSVNSNGLYVQGTATLFIGDNVDTSSCSTPINRAAGAFLSRPAGGTQNDVTANGAGTAQAISFPKLGPNDIVSLRLKTIGGAPGAYTITQTAGTGFSVTFLVGDTSVYQFIVN